MIDAAVHLIVATDIGAIAAKVSAILIAVGWLGWMALSRDQLEPRPATEPGELLPGVTEWWTPVVPYFNGRVERDWRMAEALDRTCFATTEKTEAGTFERPASTTGKEVTHARHAK